jgi:DNA topoisomerase VI subunit B
LVVRNEPNVHEERLEPNPTAWQGTELTVTILGNWQYYRAKILKYLRQIAVITPYAQFTFAYIAEDEKNSIRINFVRRTDKMPKPPKVRPGEHHHDMHGVPLRLHLRQ